MNSTARAGTAVGLLSVAVAGVWAAIRAPVAESIALADALTVIRAWPERTGVWQIDHFADAPGQILAARMLGIDSAYGLLRLGAFTAVLALILICAWTVVVSDDNRWQAGRLTVLGPITAVLLAWLGFYDPFTVLAWGLVLFSWLLGRWWVVALASVPLGFQHFEQALLGVAALVCTWLALRSELPARLRRVNPGWIVPGVVLGKAVLVGVMLANGQPAEARGRWLDLFLLDWTRAAIVTAPILLWSLFAGLWPLIVMTWLRSPVARRRTLLVGAFAVGVLASLITGDRPRVFVLVMLPSVLVATVAFAGWQGLGRRERTLVEAVAWLAPPVLLFGTSIANENIADTTIPALLHVTGLG